MGCMDELPKWKRTLPSVDHSLFNHPANIAIEFYKEHLLRDVDSGQLQPADVWRALRGFLVAAAQTYAAVCILLAKNRPKPLMLQAEVLNRSLFEIFATVLALTEKPEPRTKTLMWEFFKMLALRYDRLSGRFGQDSEWADYLDVYRSVVTTLGEKLGIPEELRKDPNEIDAKWPTPGAMVRGRRGEPFVSGTRLAVLKYFYEFHYEQQSAQVHGRTAALATAMLVGNPEEQWNPGHGESNSMTTALLLLVCILSEIESAGSYAHHPKLAELWTYLRDMMDGGSKDVWNLRYAELLSPFG